MAYPILANRLLLNLRDTTDYTTRTAVSNILFESSRFEEEQEVDNVINEIFRSVPQPNDPSGSGSGSSARDLAEGGSSPDGEEEEDEDMEGPSTALATGVDRRIPLSSRHNGSMV